MNEIAVLFICSVCCSFFFSHKRFQEYRGIITGLLCIIAAIIIGFRPLGFSDTYNYVITFKNDIPAIDEFNFDKKVDSYSEKGFMLLTSIVKTFSDSSRLYLLIISLLSFGVLSFDLKKYAVFPILGFCVYLSRFMIGRDLMQIRASLAIACVIAGTYYLAKNKNWTYFIVLLLSSLIHSSVIFMTPIIFINKKKLSIRSLWVILFITIVITAIISPFVKELAAQLTLLTGVGAAYTGADERYSEGLGLMNPMIYFQSFILLWYSYLLSNRPSILGETIKNAYLFSTVILILLSPLLVLSARLSTIFATYEIIIIPSIVYLTPKKYKIYAYLLLVILISAIFFLNFSKIHSTILINDV